MAPGAGDRQQLSVCKSAPCSLFLPRQQDFSGRNHRCHCSTRWVVWVLVKGMWCQGASRWVLSVLYGWVLRPRVLLQELTAPIAGGAKGSKLCPGLFACLGQRLGGFSRRDNPITAQPHPRNRLCSAPCQPPMALQMRCGDPGLPDKTAGSKDHQKRSNKLSVILLPLRPIKLQRVPQGQLYIIIPWRSSL